ncbi:hypothetical protein F443_20477 [Phytophthora nicotianae P1569]|uniref:Cytochrome P450 n=1 Tax=Phytophthora nicotianae P1569 TaxID=1317065 RepID=V9E0X9_PHYNI|nr:hypothetical protein F443_20477 [Phytophthora nicotianae P1569]
MLPPSLLQGDDKLTFSSSFLLGLLTVSAAATTLYTITSRKSNNLKGNAEHITQVPYLPSTLFLGNTLEVVANTARFQDWISDHSQERNGQPFAVRLLGKNDIIYMAKPEHFEQVLKEQSSNFNKGPTMHEVYSDFMGEGILLTNGDRWKYHRRVLVNLFSARALRDFMAPIIQKNVQVLTEVLSRACDTKELVDLYKLMNKFTFETFTEIGFGRKLGNLASPDAHPFELAFDEAHRISGYRFTTPSWLWKLKRWLNVGTERRLRDAMVVVDEFLMGTIIGTMERRQLDSTLNRDVVSIILDTMETSGQTMTPGDIRDIVFAGMIAGRDTTADALSWLMHALHNNPRVVKKLREEILAKLPKFAESECYVPTMDEVQELPYLEATIRELLRLSPAAPTIPYQCVRDTVFPDGTFIRAGCGVMLSLYSAARLESVWGPNAAEFAPERFIDAETGDLVQISSTPFAAFSAGPRVCVGRTLAMLELKLVTTCLVGRFRLEEAEGQNVTYSRGVSLGMKNPLLMKVARVPIEMS